MQYRSEIFKLNSFRLGMVHHDNIRGKPTIIFTIASQLPESKHKIKKYIKLSKEKYNCVAIPFNHENGEPGDNYDISTSYYSGVNRTLNYSSESPQINYIIRS